MIRLDTVERADVTQDPFPFFVASDVLDAADLDSVRSDMCDISKPGIFPLSELYYGPAFARLIEDIQSPALRDVMSTKFDVDLSACPLMITVRGRARKKDGRIHNDSETKVVTCLLYLNDRWDDDQGRLRMLRGPDDLDDYAAEVPPHGGTLASFRRCENSWHGHEPFVGERRYIMFNWMTSPEAAAHELARHRLSAQLKRLNPFA